MSKETKIEDSLMQGVEGHQRRLLFNVEEMAEMCGVTTKTWREWVRKGLAPQPVEVGTAPKWLALDIMKWCQRLSKTHVQKLLGKK